MHHYITAWHKRSNSSGSSRDEEMDECHWSGSVF